MRRMWKAGVLLAAAVALYQVGAGASGSSVPAPSAPSGSMPPMATMTPEEMARGAYNSGIDHKDKGLKLELKAATEQAKDQEKDLAKAKSEYEKSLKDFKKAADLVPNLYQAYNGMGFAYRKIGDYTKALEMYDKALALQPGFPDAIEYRGEAYLALNRVDDAKQAYLELFASDRKQADILMKAMTDWVAGRHTDPAGVDPGGVVRRSRAGSRNAARSPARRRAWRSPHSTKPGGSAAGARRARSMPHADVQGSAVHDRSGASRARRVSLDGACRSSDRLRVEPAAWPADAQGPR